MFARHLIREHDFQMVLWSADMVGFRALRDYVGNSGGDLDEILKRPGLTGLKPDLDGELLRWMRDHHFGAESQNDKPLRVGGYLSLDPYTAVVQAWRLLTQVDPEMADHVDSHLRKALAATESTGNWTSGLASLDPKLIAGKSIRYRGKLRSLGADHAALWFRADRGERVLAFDNSGSRHGDPGEWTEHCIELEIPEGIDNVNFGLIHHGAGSCWFDDLQLFIDGKLFEEPETYDFPMEDDGRGFTVMGKAYAGTMDTQEFVSGTRSLRIDRIEPPSAKDQMTPAEAVISAAGMRSAVTAAEEKIGAELGIQEARWIAQMVRSVEQFLSYRVAHRKRSQLPNVVIQSVAHNIQWHLTQEPEIKVLVLGSHDTLTPKPDTTGGLLLDQLGPNYRVIA